MTNQDYGFKLKTLSQRIGEIEELLGNLIRGDPNTDWDNATLMKEWAISKRTAANYRRKGLLHYKRGGRIYYTAENRKEFTNIKP